MERINKNVLGVTIASKKIECADRIVYETGIYRAVVKVKVLLGYIPN